MGFVCGLLLQPFFNIIYVENIENRNFGTEIRNAESAIKNRNDSAKIGMVGKYATPPLHYHS